MQLFDNSYVESMNEIVGNSGALLFIKKFADDIEAGIARKPLMIHGATGTGKTLAAHTLARERSWNVIEMNAGDYRDRQSIEKLLRSASNSRSVFGQRNLIIFDEIDELAGKNDSGASGAILDLLSNSKSPIIFIANNMWEQSISFLRGRTDNVEFRRLGMADIRAVLRNVLAKLGENVSENTIETIAKVSYGDARSALNDLLVMIGSDESTIESIGLRDRKTDIFNALDKVFLSYTVAGPLRALASTDTDNDMMINWIDENIPLRYRKLEDIHGAYQALAMATVFHSRASRANYYVYWRYMSALMSAGVALAKSQTPDTARRYSFPKRISYLSSSKQERKGEIEIARKLQKRIHLSVREIRFSAMQLLSNMARRALDGDAENEEVYDFFMNKFELTRAEVKYLAGRQVAYQAL